MLDTVLSWLGAGDSAIATMGPVITIALAWLFGGALTQFLKFPLNFWIDDSTRYDFAVRALAVVSTTAFAHYLSDSLPIPVEIGVGLSQVFAYHAFRSAVRRWWPWLEVSPLVGSVNPSPRAMSAKRERERDETETGV